MNEFRMTDSDRLWLDTTYDRLKEKLTAECRRIGTNIPYTTHNGRYGDIDTSEGIYGWCNGFWPGMLWQMYNATGEDMFKRTAEGIEERLDEALNGFEGLYHDVGFMYLPTAVTNYKLTGNHRSRVRGLHAATILAGRYNPCGRFIRPWQDEPWNTHEDSIGCMIIDCMMNINLLFWASEIQKDPRFAMIAREHAASSLERLIRPDGTASHMVVMDPVTGEVLKRPGGQGYGVGSSWGRGQGWAVLGMALCYGKTGEQSYLDAAKRVAHYCIASFATHDWMPLLDFRQPAEPVKYDSTCAMIISCGLLEVAEHVPELEKDLYVSAAIKILQAAEARFCNWDPEQDAIVGGGSYFYHDPSGENNDVPIIYADYFLTEAILRLCGNYIKIW